MPRIKQVFIKGSPFQKELQEACKDISKALDFAFKLGFREGAEVTNCALSPKRKQNIIEHIDYCNLIQKQFNVLKEKYKCKP